MYHRANALFLVVLFLLSGCGLMNAFTDPPEDDDTNVNEPDVGHDDVGHDDVGHDDVGHDDVGHDDVGHDDVGHNDVDDPEPDAGDPDIGDADTDVDLPTCEVDSVQPCGCDDLPDGEQTCQSDEEWGECVCPSLCEHPFDGEVIEGEPCGYCQLGSYSCDSEGQAHCDEERGTNFCGGCKSLPTPSSCTGSESLVCHQDETASCYATSSVIAEYHFDATGSDPDDVEIYYVFVTGDAGEICDEAWKLGAAADPPGAYRAASDYDLDTGLYTMELPSSSVSGALRTLIRRPIEVHDSDEPQVFTTHFECRPMALPLSDGGATPTPSINPTPHPHLFRGTYSMSYNATANSAAATSSLADQVGFNWLLTAMQTFFATPGYLLTGCDDVEVCPHGTFASIVDHFHQVGPTLTVWAEFIDDWTAVMDQLDRDLVVAAYQQLLEDYAAQYQPVDNAWNFLRNGNIFGSGVTATLEPVRLNGLKGLVHYHWPTKTLDEAAAPVNLSHQFGFADTVPGGPCTGDDCYPNTSRVTGTASAEIPTPTLNDDFSAVVLGEPVIQEMPLDEALIDVFFNYLPSVLMAQVVEEIDGDLIITTLEGWDDFSHLMRTVFPCDEVANLLHLDGHSQELSDDFQAVCEDLYGTTEETTVLERILQFLPVTSTFMLRNELQFVANNDCVPVFEADPVHGVRLHSIRGESAGSSCRPESVLLWSIPETGAIGQYNYGSFVYLNFEAN